MIAAVLAVCMALAATGCASGRIAASVGDRTITVTELKNNYDNNQQYASIYGYDTTTEDGRKEFLEFILDQQLSTAVQAYQAEKAGVQLTAEETEEAKAAAADDYEKFIQQFVDYAKQAGSNEPEVYANKIMGGYSSTAFGPEDYVTREQLATLLRGYAQYKGRSAAHTAGIESFNDAARVSEWAVKGLEWAVADGIIAGRNGNVLAPQERATRAEVAQMLMNFRNLKA